MFDLLMWHELNYLPPISIEKTANCCGYVELCMQSGVNKYCGVAQIRYWRSSMQHRLRSGTFVPE